MFAGRMGICWSGLIVFFEGEGFYLNILRNIDRFLKVFLFLECYEMF